MSFVAALAVLVGALGTSPAAAAITIDVPCTVPSLRAALEAANGSGGGTLLLAQSCNYTLVEPDNVGADGPNGLPVVSTPITVIGRGATVQRSTMNSTPPFRILEVAPAASLTASALTLAGGLIPGGRGGAVLNGPGARLTLNGVTLDGNRTPTTFPPEPFHLGFGGAIYNAGGGTVTLSGATLTGNGDGSQLGGAVENGGSGHIEVIGSVFRANRAGTGGAIHAGGANGSIRIRGSVFVANAGVDAGAAVDNDGSNTMEISGSSFVNNTFGSGGGVFNGGNLTITDTLLSANISPIGGGLYNGGIATVTRSRIAANHAEEGGGVYNLGVLVMIDSQVVTNRADHEGGGIFNTGHLTLSGTSVFANTPDDCINANGGTGC